MIETIGKTPLTIVAVVFLLMISTFVGAFVSRQIQKAAWGFLICLTSASFLLGHLSFDASRSSASATMKLAPYEFERDAALIETAYARRSIFTICSLFGVLLLSVLWIIISRNGMNREDR